MKKSTVYLLFTSFLVLSLNVNAQNFALGVKGGMSIPNLTAGSGNQNPINTGYSSRLGPDFGIFAEYKFSKLFSVQPMVEYSSQGGKKNGMQAFTTPAELAPVFPEGEVPQYLYANYKSEAKLNYLLIPVLAKFGWNFNQSPLRVYADAGPFVGFLLNAKQVTSGNSAFYIDPAGQPLAGGQHSFDNTENVKNNLHTTNVGIECNLGLSYRIGVNNIFIEGGGNFGFLNIQKDAANGKNNTGAATIVIGYSYWFGK